MYYYVNEVSLSTTTRRIHSCISKFTLESSIIDATWVLAQWCIKIAILLLLSCKVALPVRPVGWECPWFSVIYLFTVRLFFSPLFRRHADPWSRRWLHLHCPSSDRRACPAYRLHPAGACPATGTFILSVCASVCCAYKCACLYFSLQYVTLKSFSCNSSQFVLPGPDCSTGSACLPSTGAVCGGKQWRLHQWQHVSQPVTQLSSYTTPQILVLRLCSLFFLLLSLFTPSFMSQAHDVGGSAFAFCVYFLFWGVCRRVFDCAQSPEHDQK